MSKAIGKVLGAGGYNTSLFRSEKDVINYLNNYNTSNYDTTLNNLTKFAANASQQLNNMDNYNFKITSSDDAAKRAEQATYQNYLNYMQPQFANQMNDLTASLANKGLPIGSQAYSRAMSDMYNSQNQAYAQAANQAVLAGQNAYSNNINDQIKAANFSNTAQQNYINLLLQALQNSYSGYDIALNKYNIRNAADQRIAQNQIANRLAQQAAGDQFLNSAAVAFMTSDKRLKENIQKVGQLDNGLTVYCFNFKGCSTPQIGLLAQEVRELHPSAVSESSDGYLCVNYALACQPKKEKK